MRPDPAIDRGDCLDQLHARVLALAEELGWRPPEAMAFAESVTGRRWEDCTAADLATVEAEYLAIRRAIEEKRHGRFARRTRPLAGYRSGDQT